MAVIVHFAGCPPATYVACTVPLSVCALAGVTVEQFVGETEKETVSPLTGCPCGSVTVTVRADCRVGLTVVGVATTLTALAPAGLGVAVPAGAGVDAAVGDGVGGLTALAGGGLGVGVPTGVGVDAAVGDGVDGWATFGWGTFALGGSATPGSAARGDAGGVEALDEEAVAGPRDAVDEAAPPSGGAGSRGTRELAPRGSDPPGTGPPVAGDAGACGTSPLVGTRVRAGAGLVSAAAPPVTNATASITLIPVLQADSRLSPGSCSSETNVGPDDLLTISLVIP